MTFNKYKSMCEHLSQAIEEIDENNDVKASVQHLIWVCGWLGDMVKELRENHKTTE